MSERPTDRHGFPCPDRLLPLHPDPLSITEAQAIEMRRARGDFISGNPGVDRMREVLRGADFRPPAERDALFAHFAKQDPLEALKAQVAALQAENRALKAARAWRDAATQPPPMKPEGRFGPFSSDWVLVKTKSKHPRFPGVQYMARLRDWSMPDDGDEPNPQWIMRGPDSFTIENVDVWMPLPEPETEITE